MAQAPKPEEPDIAEVLAEFDNRAEIQAPQFVNQPALAFENNITHAPSSIHQTQPVSYLLKKKLLVVLFHAQVTWPLQFLTAYGLSQKLQHSLGSRGKLF